MKSTSRRKIEPTRWPTTPHRESHQERAWNSQPDQGPATNDIPRYRSLNAGRSIHLGHSRTLRTRLDYGVYL